MSSLRSRTIRCLVCVQAAHGSVADQAARALRGNRFRNFWRRGADQPASSGIASRMTARIELDPLRPD